MAKAASETKQATSEPESDAPEEEAVVASELDERTHAEMLLLYREAMETSRYGKAQQWRTMAIGVFSIVALGALGAQFRKDDILFRVAQFLTVLVGLSSIYLIMFYQFWQNTEREKLRRITDRFSNLARSVRAISSGREASLRRFVVLGFMILLILIAAALTIIYLTQLPAARNY